VSAPPADGPRAAPDRNPSLSLRAFAAQRREYLLRHPEIQKLSSTGVRAVSGDADPPAASPPANSASGKDASGALPSGTTVWTALDSAVHVTRTIVVPPDATLQIEPGVTVHFDEGSGITVNGRLRIEGSESQHVRLTRSPTTTGTWNGIRFVRTAKDNRLAFVDMEWSDGGGAHIRADDSAVRLDHVTWEHLNPRRQIIDLRGATSFEISSCVFPTLGSAEHVHYQGHVPEGGFAILRGNLFGGNTGYNDVIDMSTAKAPGPILQVLDNVFAGGGDDQLDLDGTDAWIEGNVFHGAHGVEGSGNPGLSASISGGTRDGRVPTFYVVRSYFYDLDRIALVKEGAFATFVNNTAVNITRGGIAFFEPDRRDFGRSASLGKGAVLDGNIFWNVAEPLQHASHGGDTAQITVRNSIINGPDVYPGSGNSNADPRLRNTNTITDAPVDLALMPDSPARDAGPNGVDMGAAIPLGASVSGVPASPTGQRAATLTVGGPQYVAYRYRLNDAAWSDEIPIDRPIQLSDLADGDYAVHVIAKNAAGVWQAEPHATVSREWTLRTAR
jgi:hypothetical protein